MDFSGLLDRQIAPAEKLVGALNHHGAALDCSAMGTGKTYVGAAVIRELDCPTVVVCPKIVINAWERTMGALGTDATVINYEMLRTGRTGLGAVVGEQFKWHPDVRMVVFDEVHRCNGDDTLNGEMLSSVKREGLRTLCLSATPAQTPLDFRNLGYVLGLHAPYVPVTLRNLMAPGPTLPNFWQWSRRHGCRPAPFGGLEFRGTDKQRLMYMDRIRAAIADKMVRVRIEDIPDFPECQITVEMYDMDKPGLLDGLYAEMQAAVQELHERRAQDKDPEHALTQQLRIRQELELLMVPALEEQSREALHAGRSPVLFVNFKQTISELSKRLKDVAHGIISGDYTALNEDTAAKFREDKFRVVLAQTDSGGVGIGLQDTRGQYPRSGFVVPGWSAINLRQLLGRLPRTGAKSKSQYRIMLPAHPIGRAVHAKLSSRLNNMDALVDADLDPCNLVLAK